MVCSANALLMDFYHKVELEYHARAKSNHKLLCCCAALMWDIDRKQNVT